MENHDDSRSYSMESIMGELDKMMGFEVPLNDDRKVKVFERIKVKDGKIEIRFNKEVADMFFSDNNNE